MTNTDGTGKPSAGWKVIRKVFFTGAIGAFAYAITNFAHQPQIWALTMSIFIGGVALVIQFLFDFESRLTVVDDRHARYLVKQRKMVDRRFADVSKATELFGHVEAAKLRTDIVVTLVQYATRIDLARNSLFTKLVQAELQAMADFLRQVVDNLHTEYPGGEQDWLFALVKNSKESVQATSTIGPDGRGLVDEGFWTSQEARAYIAYQRDAVQRGVKVRRIFVADQQELASDPENREIVQRNINAGVEVRVLSPSEVPTDRTGTVDFVLFDDEISYELSSVPMTDGKSMVRSTALELRAELVRQRKAQFAELWEPATPWEKQPQPQPAPMGQPNAT